MLEIRPNCENCGKALPYNSTDAMICSFECTFCIDCVTNVLENVCPNCGGSLEKRPIRPKEKLTKYPAQTTPYIQPISTEFFEPLKNKMKEILPANR